MAAFCSKQMDVVREGQDAIDLAMSKKDITLAQLEALYCDTRELNGQQAAFRAVLEHFSANDTKQKTTWQKFLESEENAEKLRQEIGQDFNNKDGNCDGKMCADGCSIHG